MSYSSEISYGHINVPHLGGISVHYATPKDAVIDSAKPTVLLIPGYMTSVDLFLPQFTDTELVRKFNLVAVDPLGHGKTVDPKGGHWTYWDNAIVFEQALEKMGVDKFWVVGTAQGGWIAPRMALLRPEKVRGMVIMGTSQDSESARTRKHGCWDGGSTLDPLVSAWSTPSSPKSEEWMIPKPFVELLIDSSLPFENSKVFDANKQQYWKDNLMRVYKGEEGRKKAWMCAITLKDRESLHARLGDIRCPVIWLQGTADPIFTVANAQEEIKLFSSAPRAEVRVIENGTHYMSATHPEPVKDVLMELVGTSK